MNDGKKRKVCINIKSNKRVKEKIQKCKKDGKEWMIGNNGKIDR